MKECQVFHERTWHSCLEMSVDLFVYSNRLTELETLEALKYVNKIPSDILTNLDQLTTKAKEQIEIMKFKQNGLKFLNKKYKVILDYLKEHTDYKIDANNVLAVKSLLGFDEVVELASGQKIINKIPSYDKAVVILDALLELNIIQGDKHELSDRL